MGSQGDELSPWGDNKATATPSFKEEAAAMRQTTEGHKFNNETAQISPATEAKGQGQGQKKIQADGWHLGGRFWCKWRIDKKQFE